MSRRADACGILLCLVGCTPQAAPSTGANSNPPSSAAAAPASAAPANSAPARPVHISHRSGQLIVNNAGSPEGRLPLTRNNVLAAPEHQRRHVVATSWSEVGGARSDPQGLAAQVGAFPNPDGTTRVLLEPVGSAEPAFEFLTRLMPHGFKDIADREFTGFNRALLPSVLLDPLPADALGSGARWTVTSRFLDGADTVDSVREYHLVERVQPSADAPWRDDAPLSRIEFVWREGSAGQPASVTRGVWLFSRRWLYPLANLVNESRDGQVAFISQLSLHNPAWTDLTAPAVSVQ